MEVREGLQDMYRSTSLVYATMSKDYFQQGGRLRLTPGSWDQLRAAGTRCASWAEALFSLFLLEISGMSLKISAHCAGSLAITEVPSTLCFCSGHGRKPGRWGSGSYVSVLGWTAPGHKVNTLK